MATSSESVCWFFDQLAKEVRDMTLEKAYAAVADSMDSRVMLWTDPKGAIVKIKYIGSEIYHTIKLSDLGVNKQFFYEAFAALVRVKTIDISFRARLQLQTVDPDLEVMLRQKLRAISVIFLRRDGKNIQRYLSMIRSFQNVRQVTLRIRGLCYCGRTNCSTAHNCRYDDFKALNGLTTLRVHFIDGYCGETASNSCDFKRALSKFLPVAGH